VSYAIQLGTYIIYTHDPEEAIALNELRSLLLGEKNAYNCRLLLKAIYILTKKYVPTALFGYCDVAVAGVIRNGRCIESSSPSFESTS